MKKNNMYVGMDTDKNSIDVAIGEEGRNKEVRHYGRIENNLSALDKLVCKLETLGHTLHFVYEAGPCGYTIYRHLAAKGIDCVVVAPSQIPKRSGDRVKTNRRDAINLARLHRAGELHRVYVPLSSDGLSFPSLALSSIEEIVFTFSFHYKKKCKLHLWLC